MNIFDVVNELSVLCVTLLMMAVSTIWYSSWMFGDIWMREAKITNESISPSKSDMFRKTLLTFFCYFCMTMCFAYIVAVAPQLHLSLKAINLFLIVFVGALLGPVSIWEQKTLRYFLVSIGFMSVFITLGLSILASWPW